ncbi:hypothetical protein ABK040_007407 [Willaertia magna]
MSKASSSRDNDDTGRVSSSRDNNDTGSHYMETNTHKDKQTTRVASIKINKNKVVNRNQTTLVFKQKKIINKEDYKILSEKIIQTLSGKMKKILLIIQ